MAITTQYVVTHKGVEKLVTTDKKAADHYDKMLETADNLAAFIEAKGIALTPDIAEELSILLAKNKEEVTKLLKGAKLEQVLKEQPAEVVKLKANR